MFLFEEPAVFSIGIFHNVKLLFGRNVAIRIDSFRDVCRSVEQVPVGGILLDGLTKKPALMSRCIR